nr:hypothetical protein [Desulfovibrio porci]
MVHLHSPLRRLTDFFRQGRAYGEKRKEFVKFQSVPIGEHFFARLKMGVQIFPDIFGEHATTTGSPLHDAEVEFPANGFIGEDAGVVV